MATFCSPRSAALESHCRARNPGSSLGGLGRNTLARLGRFDLLTFGSLLLLLVDVGYLLEERGRILASWLVFLSELTFLLSRGFLRKYINWLDSSF